MLLLFDLVDEVLCLCGEAAPFVEEWPFAEVGLEVDFRTGDNDEPLGFCCALLGLDDSGSGCIVFLPRRRRLGEDGFSRRRRRSLGPASRLLSTLPPLCINASWIVSASEPSIEGLRRLRLGLFAGMRVDSEGSEGLASVLGSLDGEISGSEDMCGAEILGKVEGLEGVGMAGWSVVNGVNWLWGASSARTKAAGHR